MQILGTFITEWESGSLLCELLLWTEQSAEAGAMQLAQIAAYYGFDGWLLNIENPVLQRLIPNLIHFIRQARNSKLSSLSCCSHYPIVDIVSHCLDVPSDCASDEGGIASLQTGTVLVQPRQCGLT